MFKSLKVLGDFESLQQGNEFLLQVSLLQPEITIYCLLKLTKMEMGSLPERWLEGFCCDWPCEWARDCGCRPIPTARNRSLPRCWWNRPRRPRPRSGNRPRCPALEMRPKDPGRKRHEEALLPLHDATNKPTKDSKPLQPQLLHIIKQRIPSFAS